MSENKQIQTVVGTVVKKTTPQTVKVATKVTKVHPLYKKRYTLTRTYVAHDPSDSHVVGDNVTIEACRPISKSKHWIIKEA
jgi:small subunit ribosomal protein S17